MGYAASFRHQTPGADRFAVLALACAAVATFTVGLRKALDAPQPPDTAQVVVMEARAETPRRWATVDPAPEPVVEQAAPRAAVARTVQVDAVATESAPVLQMASATAAATPAVATVDEAVVPQLPDAAAEVPAAPVEP